MAVTNFSPLLGLALPTTGDLSGTWGTTVNDAITGLLDSAVAGTTTLSANADVTLSTTNGAANQARSAVILWTASNGATTRNITAPAQSKAYVVINAGTGSIVLRGAGPTTGVTIVAGEKCLAAWNGSDFVKIATSAVGDVTLAGTQTLTNKTIAYADNTLTGVVGTTATQTLTNKTISGADNTLTVDGTNSVGFRSIPQNSQSADYTLVLADAGKHIFHPVADNNARTFTIPANSSVAYPIGTAITFINMAVANVTIAITTDTLILSSAGTTGSRTLATNGSATCIKITSTSWLISGSGLT